MISKGYALLAEAHSAADDDDEDVAPAKSKVTNIASRKGTSKASDDDDDSEDSPKSSKSDKVEKPSKVKDEDAKPAAGTKEQKQALAALKDLDIDGASRIQMKPIAEALGVPFKGVVTEELQKALAKIQKNGLSGAAATADEDDEDEAPPAKSSAKKKPAKDDDADDDDDEEVEYPEKKEMRRQMRLWAKAHRAAIIKALGKEYFDADDDADDPATRLHQTLANLDVLKKQWKDNVYELIQDGSWKKIEKEYAEDDE